ncbi:alpha/beta fold hydrolase [Acinetobacter sp. MB5]|uniref:alpha/beta fold hydrolase n=1 Tax=Acinetobacter sp. MB5 TaxID=2069438 RepID=UPI000DCFB4C7|nr:alpha/beta hydrolase [Acinetobacter sp. MB5]
MISKTLQLSNQRVHYLEAGQGEPLILIHGVGMQASAWYPQIEYFSKHYHVIALDMPGHGQSSCLPEQASLQDFVDWTIDVIQALGLGAVNLAGHSMGSLITAGVAASAPQLVKRIAVLNGVYKRTPEAKQAVQARAAELRQGVIDIQTPLQRWFSNTETDQFACAKVKMWLSEVNLQGYATAYTAFAHGDDIYADRWSSIHCPALVLTGEQDLNSTAEMTYRMAEQAEKGQAVVIPDERHMVNLTAPNLVNQAMQNWLHTPA